MDNTTVKGNKDRVLGKSMINPLVNKLSKIKETDDYCCTYGGVMRKCIYFVITIFFGVALCFFLNSFGGHFFDNPVITDKGFVFRMDILTAPGCLGAGIALFLFAFTPFFAFLIRPIIPAFGTLYTVSTGYIIMFLAMAIEQYRGPIVLALVLTVSVTMGLAFLYSTGRIRVTGKFKTCLMALLISMLIGSVFVLISSFIPPMRFLVNSVTGNPVISIAISLVGVFIGCMMLLYDFDTVHDLVENKLPKKYEWLGAFSLTFSVIWLYFKILELILKIMGNSRR